MRTTTLTLLLGLLLGGACQDPEPDLESVSRARCTMVRKCARQDFYELWNSLEACEASSAEAFAAVETKDRLCFDARLAWETCQGMTEDCEEFVEECDEVHKNYYRECFP
jgi:hypothetical protein